MAWIATRVSKRSPRWDLAREIRIRKSMSRPVKGRAFICALGVQKHVYRCFFFRSRLHSEEFCLLVFREPPGFACFEGLF
jgi:hypothetical protein